MRQRSAKPRPQQPYTQCLCFGDQIVELPLHTAPDNLEKKLRRFDLALSAIDAEHCAGDQWRAVIHPIAHQTVSEHSIGPNIKRATCMESEANHHDRSKRKQTALKCQRTALSYRHSQLALVQGLHIKK